MKIVDLHPNDTALIEETARVLFDAFQQMSWPTMDDAREEVLGLFGNDTIRRVALDDEAHVLGWIGAISQYENHAWELHPLAVRPDQQRKGVGRALVQDLEACVRERGAITLYLGTDDINNQTSLGGVDLYPNVFEHITRIQNLRNHPYEFYQRMGFVIVGVIPDANGFGKPDILMAKRVRRMTRQHISVVTLNILNDLRRWDERKDMLVNELRHLQPDLIALQEVKLPLNNGQWIAEQLGGYSVHLTPKHGKKHSKEEGLAILSRLPVDHVHSTSLGGQNRVAQFVQVQLDGKRLLFANGHFFWYPGDHSQRSRQIRVLHTWLKKHAELAPASVVVCGDFNGTPETPAIQAMQAPLGWTQFQSAHTCKHGREPDWTCPTPLQWRHEPWRKAVFNVVGLAVQKKRGPWRGTLDYIFVNERVSVEECRVVFNQPALHDPTLYPSDHLGLHATLRIH